MADFTFDCPACKQPVQADTAWAGQEIQCPLCHAPMIVPKAVGGGAKQGGASHAAHMTGRTAMMQKGAHQKSGKAAKPMLRHTVSILVFVAFAIGGFFAWPYLRPYVPFLKKAEETPAATAATAASPATPDAKPVEPATPPPPRVVPMSPPIYTLDAAQAKISEGKVNGTIAGTNFVPDTVRLDKQVGGYVLSLRQGSGLSPDHAILVQLQLPPAESPTGHTWAVSQDMKGTAVSRVTKLWKPNPKYAAQQKAYTTGFALKLEFGQFTESNTLPGKIFVALPDAERTVVGGVFNAVTLPAGAVSGAPQAPPADTRSAAEKAEFDRRYGIRRK